MDSFKYAVIGGGLAALNALEAIAEVDPQGSILLVGAETVPPYDRPPLSKTLWTGQKTLADIMQPLPQANLTTYLGHRVTAIDPTAKTLSDDQGNTWGWDKLLLATGGAPRRLPFADEGVIYLRDLTDYQKLRSKVAPGKKVAVIGGGFIGSEIACALAGCQVEVDLIFPEQRIGERLFPAQLAQFVTDYLADRRVTLHPEQKITGLTSLAERYRLQLASGQSLEADVVVAGLGLLPAVELAQNAGLAVDNGITVDPFLRTTHPDIWAAGDVANFYSPLLAKRLRLEHEDNSRTMGRCAGRNMAGCEEPYQYLAFFYSDLFDLGYEAIGEVDARHQQIEDWIEPNRKGVIYYLNDGWLRGVLLWNVWGQVDAARDLLGQRQRFTAEQLIGLLRD